MTQAERRPILRSPRLLLRPAERTDLPVFVEWLNDADVVETLGGHGPLSLAAEEGWFEQLQQEQGSTRWHFVICLRDGGRPIGTAGLDDLSFVSGRAELGIAIGDRGCWDQGYGTEAVGILLDFAFGELRLERVFLYVFGENARAIRVYERAGFTLEGTLRHSFFRHGRWLDTCIMGILRDEWAAQERRRSWELD